MYKVIIYSTILISQILFGLSTAYAWKMPFEVSTTTDEGLKIYNKLVIGVESGATDRFDNLWDTPALLLQPDPDAAVYLSAYITGNDNDTQGGNKLWKDIRDSISKRDIIWDITVESAPAGKTIAISWIIPQGILETGERILLRDNDKLDADGKPVEVDISKASNYTFVSADMSRSLYIVLSKKSANSSSSGSGSGFGCGTIRSFRDGSNDSGMSALNIIILFSPLVILKLFRLYPVTRQSQD